MKNAHPGVRQVAEMVVLKLLTDRIRKSPNSPRPMFRVPSPLLSPTSESCSPYRESTDFLAVVREMVRVDPVACVSCQRSYHPA